MNLKEFEKIYLELEDKLFAIKDVYGYSYTRVENINFYIPDDGGKSEVSMELMFSNGGYCDTIGFDLEEVYNNDIEYFKQKFNEKQAAKKAKELVKKEEERQKKEAKDKAEYERLKAKFEK